MSENLKACFVHFGESSRTVKAASILCWAIFIAGGFGALWHYTLTPGRIDEPPSQWPPDSAIERADERKTLVIFAHPQCPCTQATVGELARLMTRCEQGALVYVLFQRPTGADDGWDDTALCRAARGIPGVQVQTDWDGVEARRFHAKTSGLCVLYDTDGRLLFHGGITTARGHAGDNDGAAAIVAFVTTGESTIIRTPVFGCPIVDEYGDGSNE